MPRHDHDVVYPPADADGVDVHRALPGSHSLAEVVALLHIVLQGRTTCRVALVFTGGECSRLCAILNGTSVYREAEIPGSAIAPAIVDRLVAAAETARRARAATSPRTRKPSSTDAAVDVVADPRLADAITRHGPRVVLRLLLYRAQLARLIAPMDSRDTGERPPDSAAA